MYRFLIFFFILSTAAAHCWREPHDNCYRRHHDRTLRHRERSFSNLVRHLISVDRTVGSLCLENSNNKTKEVYEGEYYKLITSLEDFSETDITVQIKYRVIYINAEKHTETGTSNYFELRILPEFVAAKNATWDFSDGELHMLVPYKENTLKGKESPLSCNEDFDESVIAVPKYEPKLDVRIAPQTEPDTSTVPDDEDISINKKAV